MKLNTKGCEKVAARLKEITTFIYEEFARHSNMTDYTELFELFDVSDFKLVLEDGNKDSEERSTLTELSIYETSAGKALIGVPSTVVYAVMPTIKFIFGNKDKEAGLLTKTIYLSEQILNIIETMARVKFNGQDALLINLDRGTRTRNGIRKFYLTICLSIIIDDTEYELV